MAFNYCLPQQLGTSIVRQSGLDVLQYYPGGVSSTASSTTRRLWRRLFDQTTFDGDGYFRQE
jgi:hypothetical protein